MWGGGGKVLIINELQTPLAQLFFIMCYRCFTYLAFAFLTLTIIFSCQKSSEGAENVDSPAPEFSYSSLLPEINALNKEYGYSDTRGMGRDFITRGADAIGACVGASVGIAAGAGITAVTGSPLCGYYIGRLATGFLGTAGWVVASNVAGKVYDHYSGGCGLVVPGNGSFWDLNNFRNNQEHCDLDFVSPGELHNIILNALRSNGKSYLNEDGSIMIEEMYDDVLQIERDLGIDDEMSDSYECRSTFLNYCKDIETSTHEYFINQESTDQYYSKIMQSACINSDRSLAEIEEIWELVSQLKAPLVLSEEQTIEYERSFEEIVIESSLPEGAKEELAIVGSVAIMSLEFWE